MNLEVLGLPLHFLRPQWLWLLLALPAAWAWMRSRRRRIDVWEDHVDPHLRAHVLEGPDTRMPRRGGRGCWRSR